MIRVGSARADEFGGIGYGAQPGDQTTHECETQDWYLHEKGWVVLRAKSAEAREKIAKDMEYICENPHIGYSQPHDQTLYKAAKPFGFNCSLVTQDCETDCAKAVRVCCLYAGIEVNDFWTGTEINTLGATGEFEIFRSAEYTQDWKLLKRGDILCTASAGHTVVVLDDGPGVPSAGTYRATGNVYLRTGPGTEYPALGVIKKGDTMEVQIALTSWAYGIAIGKTGYASMKYLTPIEEQKTLTATGNLNLRTGAGILNRSIGVIKKGDAVKLTGAEKTVLGRVWYEVKADGKTGWASSKYLA